MGGFCGVVSKGDCVSDLFFGTDYPMWTPQEEIARVMALPLTDEEREMIFHKNFERFIGEA